MRCDAAIPTGISYPASMRLALGMGLAALLALAGCGDDDGPGTDAGTDVGTTDGGGDDGGGDDGGDDAGTDDAGDDDAGTDDAGGDDAGPTDCESDSECTAGEQWCVGGTCVACDNSGLALRHRLFVWVGDL